MMPGTRGGVEGHSRLLLANEVCAVEDTQASIAASSSSTACKQTLMLVYVPVCIEGEYE
jgi:hypothetical protein